MDIFRMYIFLAGALLSLCDCSRIFVIVAIGTKSHTTMFNPLVEGLASRGHEIVYLTVRKLDKPVPGVTEYVMEGAEAFVKEHAKKTYAAVESENPFSKLREIYTTLAVPVCEMTLQNANVQKLLKSDDNFDLVLVDSTLNECLLGFIHKFKAPYIAFGLPGALTWNNDAVGNSNNYAYIPNVQSSYSDRMTFMERVTNLVESVHLDLVRNYLYLPKLDKVVQKHFGYDLPPTFEMERNASMLFVNSHFSMSPPRPNLPAAIDVGALHCRPAQPLPKEYEDFISEAGDAGFIYFSMGTALPASQMPTNKMKMFQNVLAKLKQRVIWKWEVEMSDKPANVLTKKWFSQQDFLGHPKIRLFISHGGLFGTQEATYHGVPVVSIPMIADQFINAKRVEAAGYARVLNFFSLTEETLMEAIQEVLNNSTYKENAVFRSKMLKDQPESPLDRAIFWTEYVLRHRGAQHMRSAVLDLAWYQRAMLDVALLFLLIIISVSFIMYSACKCVVKAVNKNKRKQE